MPVPGVNSLVVNLSHPDHLNVLGNLRHCSAGASLFLAATKQLYEWYFLSVCGYVAWEWWEFRWSNKWNWYSSGLNASILVWHTCASALSGWVLYRQLELTKLTRPDLHHVVGLFILKDVRQSLEYPCALRVPRTSPHGFLSSLVIQSLWICCLRMMGISVK